MTIGNNKLDGDDNGNNKPKTKTDLSMQGCKQALKEYRYSKTILKYR